MSKEIELILEEAGMRIAKLSDEKKKQYEKIKLQQKWMTYKGEDEIVTMAEIVEHDKEFSATLEEYSSGYGSLDALLKNFRTTELITISGPTKNGKTTLAMSLTSNFLRDKHIPCWFSYEMTPAEFAEKMPAGELPLIYAPRSLKTNNTEWIENKIVEANVKFGATIFFIDHLHFVCDLSGKQNENTSVRIGRAMRELKMMARNWNVCIFLIAHTTKIPANQAPTVSALRDSSFIGQESNTVIYVQRQGPETSYTNNLKVHVLANRRNGQNGELDLAYSVEERYLHEIYR